MPLLRRRGGRSGRRDKVLTMDLLRRRISSARDLHSIVRTMKTLSAVNIRHYERAVASIGEYYRTVEMGFQVVLREGLVALPVARSRESRLTCSVILGSDQGLCGGFNDQIVSFALGTLHEPGHRDSRVICGGDRAHAILEERGHPVSALFHLPGSLAGISPLVHRMVVTILEMREQEGIDRVLLFHQRPLSNVAYGPAVSRLLPLDREWFLAIERKPWPSRVLPTYTMDREALFSALVRQYVFASLARAVAESMASENAARLASMQAAERSIEERLEELDSLYRQRRQESITAELLDLVSGFEALRTAEEA